MTSYLGLEEAARFVEQHELVHTSEGEQTRPRRDGNRAGLGYASGIRALADSARLSQAGAGGGVDLERVAKSLADMLIEYVDGGINSNQNWRNGLNEIVLARLRRLMPAALAPSPSAGWHDLHEVPPKGQATPPATPVQPTASGMQAVKGDDYQNKGQDHKTFGITVTSAWLDLHREPQPHGNMIEVYRLEAVRDRILTLLQRHGFTDKPTASMEAMARAKEDALDEIFQIAFDNRQQSVAAAAIERNDQIIDFLSNVAGAKLPADRASDRASLTPAPTQGEAGDV